MTARIERCTPADLMQLASDLPGSPMQVAAVLVLASTPELTAVRAALGERIKAVPRLRQRLARTAFGGGRPVWVDDPEFHIRNHVDAVAGDEAGLLGVAAATVSRRLPRDRPLWSVTLVTGLPGGGAALITVLHHVLADGLGGLAVLGCLIDGSPAAPESGFPRPAPGRRDLVLDAARRRLRALRRRPTIPALGGGTAPRPPHSSLNRPIGDHRRLAVARADLAGLRRVAHAHGATVNDALLTAVSGALCGVLRRRGEDIDRFVLSVPVAARHAAAADQLGNQVGFMPVPVLVAGDPLQRLAAVARTTRARRPADPQASAALIRPLFRVLAAVGLFRWFADRQPLVTTMVTDLRGPATRLSFLSVPVTEILPVTPITGNVTVGFAALSYAGTLVVTVTADPDRCPDLPWLASGLQGELDDLVAVGT